MYFQRTRVFMCKYPASNLRSTKFSIAVDTCHTMKFIAVVDEFAHVTPCLIACKHSDGILIRLGEIVQVPWILILDYTDHTCTTCIDRIIRPSLNHYTSSPNQTCILFTIVLCLRNFKYIFSKCQTFESTFLN